MTDVGEQEIGQTYDCRKANCDGVARSNRGTYAYLCDFHADQRKREQGHGVSAPIPTRPTAPTPARTPPASNGSVPTIEGELKRLQALARKCDRLRQKQARLTKTALVAKADADRAEQEYRDALREAVGDSS